MLHEFHHKNVFKKFYLIGLMKELYWLLWKTVSHHIHVAFVEMCVTAVRFIFHTEVNWVLEGRRFRKRPL